jgi:hypothetical protein
MSELEKVWRAKTDEEVLAAARQLGKYSEEGERAIRAELRRRGFGEPPPIIGHSDAGGEPRTSISYRYTDAYRVASAIITFGTTVKVIGAVVAAIIAIAGLAYLGSGGLIGGLLLGAMAGLIFWIAGVFVTAQGQLLRASLDTAVNTSPLLSNTEKAKMMGIAQSTANV